MSITKAQIQQWRSLISRNKLEQCLEEMQEAADELSPSLVNMIIHFRARHAELKKQERLGTISYSSANTERNKIVAGVLELLSEMEREVKEETGRFSDVRRFKGVERNAEVFAEVEPPPALEEKASETAPPPPAPSQKPKEEGAILYRIPGRMQLGRESRCVVRLAFDEKTVKEGLEDAEDIVVKSVRVEEVMEVELLDPNEDPAFQIRPITDQEQVVEQASFTEWIFKVKPLREGTFPLLLKVSVVLFINGKDRKKNIVLEEMVEVSTAPVAEAPGTGRFKAYDPTVAELPGAPMYISWSGSEEDASFKKDFEKQLYVLQRSGMLHYWDKSKIKAGEMATDALRNQLSRASLFAILISPDYLSNDDCYQELGAIYRQEKNREAAIVPVLVRDCSYDLLDIGRRQILPRSGKPIAQYPFPDAVWTEIVREVHKMVKLLEKAEN